MFRRPSWVQPRVVARYVRSKAGTSLPVLSGITAGSITATGATLTVSASAEGTATLYVVVYPSSATQPSASQIKSGLNGDGGAATWAAGSGSGVAWTGSPQDVTASGLTAGTSYKASAVVSDGSTDGTPVHSAAFTTNAVGTTDLSVAFAIAAAGTFDLSASFAIAASASADLAASYEVRNAGSSDLAASYAVAAAGTADLSASYGIATTGSADLACSFEIQNAGSGTADLAANYAIAAAGTSDLSASYAVRNAGTADLSASYAIEGIQTSDLACAYAIAAGGSADLAASYDVAAGGYADLSGEFAILGSGAADIVVTYAVDGSTGGGASPAAIWAYEIAPGLSAADALLACVNWLDELHRIHGLRSGVPLEVTQTARTAGAIVQSITEAAGTVTVERS